MKAVVQNDYGSPDVLELAEVAEPAMKENEVRVRVHAASLNAGDVYFMKGDPWPTRLMGGLPRPKNYILGCDVAGCVEAVGSRVTRFKPGDEVFGAGSDGKASRELTARIDGRAVPGRIASIGGRPTFMADVDVACDREERGQLRRHRRITDDPHGCRGGALDARVNAR